MSYITLKIDVSLKSRCHPCHCWT